MRTSHKAAARPQGRRVGTRLPSLASPQAKGGGPLRARRRIVTTAATTLVKPAPALEPLQRLCLRDQLQDLWRAEVEHITTLAVQFHSFEADDKSVEETAAVAERLAGARLQLNEVEAAMRRMDVGLYGGCEGCKGRITYDALAAR